MRSHRGAGGSPRDGRPARWRWRRQHGHSSRTLAVATQVNYRRPCDARSVRVRLASRSVTVSLRRPRLRPRASSRLVALYLYAPATATLPMEVDGRTLGCHERRTGPAYYCITPAGRVTNGDRSPPGPAGLTCCRSARSHITSTYWSAVVGVG